MDRGNTLPSNAELVEMRRRLETAELKNKIYHDMFKEALLVRRLTVTQDGNQAPPSSVAQSTTILDPDLDGHYLVPRQEHSDFRLDEWMNTDDLDLSLGNSGMGQNDWTQSQPLVAFEGSNMLSEDATYDSPWAFELQCDETVPYQQNSIGIAPKSVSQQHVYPPNTPMSISTATSKPLVAPPALLSPPTIQWSGQIYTLEHPPEPPRASTRNGNTSRKRKTKKTKSTASEQ